MSQLRNYAIGETSAAGVENALAAAEAMLAQMRSVQLEPAVSAAQTEMRSASDLLSRLRGLLDSGTGRLKATSERLQRLMERATDMTYLLEDGVQQPIAEVSVTSIVLCFMDLVEGASLHSDQLHKTFLCANIFICDLQATERGESFHAFGP